MITCVLWVLHVQLTTLFYYIKRLYKYDNGAFRMILNYIIHTERVRRPKTDNVFYPWLVLTFSSIQTRVRGAIIKVDFTVHSCESVWTFAYIRFNVIVADAII